MSGMRAALVLCMIGWGRLTGYVVVAMTGAWWQLPYFAVIAVAGAVGYVHRPTTLGVNAQVAGSAQVALG
jgi:hypothetical protein